MEATGSGFKASVGQSWLESISKCKHEGVGNVSSDTVFTSCHKNK
jgi:hypothetical protein